MIAAIDVFRTIAPPSFISGSPFCTVKKSPFTFASKCRAHVEVESLVEVLFGDLFERGGLTLAGAGKEDVDPALFALDGLVEAVEVGEIAGIALYAGDVLADELHGLIELLLATSGDEDVGALFNEELCCCERHA